MLLEEKNPTDCLPERDASLYSIHETMKPEPRKKLLHKGIPKEKQCKSTIIQRIADSHLIYIKEKCRPCDICKTLISTFERKGTQLLL